jgi:hypothetical protein
MIGVFADALAAVAVAAVVAGWALGQWPTILPGLDVREAAAPHDTLVAVVVAVLGGGAIVFPSLALLFRLTLAGQLDARAARNRAARRGQATRGRPDCPARPHGGGVSDRRVRAADGRRCRLGARRRRGGVVRLHDHCFPGARAGRAPRGAVRRRRRVSARNSASCLTPTQRGAEEETLLLWRLA